MEELSLENNFINLKNKILNLKLMITLKSYLTIILQLLS